MVSYPTTYFSSVDNISHFFSNWAGFSFKHTQCTNPGQTTIPIKIITSQINPKMGISSTCLGEWCYMTFKIIIKGASSSPGMSCMMGVVSSCLEINMFLKSISFYNQNLKKLTSSWIFVPRESKQKYDCICVIMELI